MTKATANTAAPAAAPTATLNANHGLPTKIKKNKKDALKVVQVWMEKDVIETLRQAHIDIPEVLRMALMDAHGKVKA